MENNRGELNHVFCLVAALGILRCLYATVKGICFLLIPEAVSLDGAEIVLSNHRALMVAVVANLLLLVSLMLTLLKNRLGVYGFAVVTFLFYTVSSAFYEDKSSQLWINICLMLVQNAAFVGLLMIKRDGVRSWHLFFPKKEVAHEAETEEKQGSAKVSAGLSGLKEQADVVPSALTFLQKQDNPLPEDKRDYTKEDRPVCEAARIPGKEKHTEKTALTMTKKPGTYKKAAAVTLLGGLLAVGLGAGVWELYKTRLPEYQYAKADSLLKSGRTDEALQIYTRLADKEGYVKAKTKLGSLYVDKSFERADELLGVKYLEEAWHADSTALVELMRFYISPETTSEERMDRCEQVAQEAVRKGWCIGSAHCALGIVAVRREDYSLAYYHWLKAAELNRADGYAFLGILYYYGDGCPADVGKARQCWQKALELDSENHYALYYLGLLYKEGYGVSQDFGKAYECLYKAAELGNDDAKKEVADLKTRHTSEELFGSSHHAVP